MWRSELAVGGECSFEGDEGNSGANEVSECIVEVACLLLEHANGDLDTCGSQLFKTATADEWIGIGCSDDDARDACGYKGVGAGTGASLMTAGLESDVGCGTLHGVPSTRSLFQGDDLSMVEVVVEMRSFA
jgi:hypothetical protein